MASRPLKEYQWMTVQRIPHVVAAPKVFKALDDFLEAGRYVRGKQGPFILKVEDAWLGKGKPFYLLRRSLDQLTPRWGFKKKVQEGHDILLQVERMPRMPYISVTASVFLNRPESVPVDPDHPEMKLGKLKGVPDHEACYRFCESLDDLRDKLGPAFKIVTTKYAPPGGLEFTVVIGIQEEQAGGVRVVGYYGGEYYRDWYLVIVKEERIWLA
ncbi:hypothetical protein H9Q70_004085 [Fusarium xylarioides]|nr:hypothetical protein H9Q70_004085 [Fusarium xylarioides]KAG5777333.1 hypothetical protein H9Q73_008998 [Fusarium xylarioides]